ncbi:MAG: HAD family hydrolase [Peptostreptococcus sp.]|uniref:HAD family hydrolase n=1 Tax=Peptostreptococcus sp. TaxID=1262 RepID=UPI002FC58546
MIFVFDIDDTLYDLEDPFKLAFFHMFGHTPSDIHDIFLDFRKYNNEVYEQALLGEITMEEMCIYRAQNAFKDHGIIIDEKKALEFQLLYLKDKKYIKLNEYIEALLKFLKKKQIPMGIISNGPHKEQFEKISYLGVERYIPRENIFISEDVGFHKPSVEIFDYAREHILENLLSRENNQNNVGNHNKYKSEQFDKKIYENSTINSISKNSSALPKVSRNTCEIHIKNKLNNSENTKQNHLNTSKIIKNKKVNSDYDFFYIGDSYSNDICGAYNAGYRSIWINHRKYSHSNMICKADYELSSFEKLFDLIVSLVD